MMLKTLNSNFIDLEDTLSLWFVTKREKGDDEKGFQIDDYAKDGGPGEV